MTTLLTPCHIHKLRTCRLCKQQPVALTLFYAMRRRICFCIRGCKISLVFLKEIYYKDAIRTCSLQPHALPIELSRNVKFRKEIICKNPGRSKLVKSLQGGLVSSLSLYLSLSMPVLLLFTELFSGNRDVNECCTSIPVANPTPNNPAACDSVSDAAIYAMLWLRFDGCVRA